MRPLALALLASLTTACGARTELAASSTSPPPDCGAPWVLFTFESEVPGQPAVGSEIHARRADGSDARVSRCRRRRRYPSITPDGTGLLYAGPSLQSLFLYDLAGGAEQQLDTTGQVGFGTVSPDGATVVYGDGNNLWVVGVGGALVQQLLVPSGSTPTGAAGYPAFERDSKTVVFAEGGTVSADDRDGRLRPRHVAHGGGAATPSPTRRSHRTASRSPRWSRATSPRTSCARTRFASLPAACASGAVVTTVPGSPPYYDLGVGARGAHRVLRRERRLPRQRCGRRPAGISPRSITGPDASASEPAWAPACAVLP